VIYYLVLIRTRMATMQYFLLYTYALVAECKCKNCSFHRTRMAFTPRTWLLASFDYFNWFLAVLSCFGLASYLYFSRVCTHKQKRILV
jgi:hypothetical protein